MNHSSQDRSLASPAPDASGSLRQDWSLSAITAGFLAVLISYSGPLVIFFQAAKVANMPNEMISSWVWAISMGAAVSGIVLSWRLKVPVVTAWSAPGTALLVTLFPGVTLNQAVGAYLTAAVVLLLIGASGSFDRLMRHIPKGIAAGMMAGILFQFGASAFKSVGSMPVLAFGMVGAYLLFKRLLPRYCIVLVLLCGAALAVLLGQTHLGDVRLSLATPQFIRPEWTLGTTLSLALPLVMVSLTGQHLPGMAVLRVSGYDTPAKPIITVTSLASLVVAFFGGITIVIAAITAALCTGKDAHDDPSRRYVAGIANGAFYLIGGMFGSTIVLLFTALPKEFVAVLAGLALIGAISANVQGAVEDAEHREASMITFLATASGMSFLGLGSAFWGVVIGCIAYLVLNKPHQRQAKGT
ncbi:benzoate/H(+) symporter BenE family transporter [Pseudogulbenkiania ferrooxidans]|uniref:Benzoate transporter n=1 Tax=Pseudogulbenkiania ferrooxidans 2002 TaxID=279714 RepID=B9Z3J7_9NEIS|nr:benzoate/H(+) symporter BenE family transporter [Pseudogulbenkiania ferrooxidans]EEG08424.1 benzoate transporter [Pseudogulbenkiania ferrooxidans 2002]